MTKSMGKIIEFDGFSGVLIDKEKHNHIFSREELLTKDIKVGELVSFESEIFTTVDNKIYIARFVKRLEEE